MIITHVCKVRPDHFKVNWVEGRFRVNEWVQDYSWRGPMVVVRFAAENRRELVVECMGWAESGRQIARFLVLEKSWVDRPDNLVVSLWSNIWPWGLSKALDSEWYLPQEGDGNNLHYSIRRVNETPKLGFTVYNETSGSTQILSRQKVDVLYVHCRDTSIKSNIRNVLCSSENTADILF